MARTIKNTVTSWIHPTAGQVLVATHQRSRVERALNAAGLGVKGTGLYQQLAKDADENYDGPGAEIALQNIGQVYVVDGTTVTPVVPVDDLVATLRTHAANALVALDAGDMDAVRAALVAASQGAPASVQVTVDGQDEPAAAEYEPSDLEIQVLETIQKLESASAEEIGAQVEGDVENAIVSLHQNGMVAEDGHNTQGATSYCAA